MTQPQGNVIFLPPGVVPPPQQGTPGQPQQIGPQFPFGRDFFAEQLPRAIEAFCQQATCDNPMVELLTVDGQRHYVNAISGASDTWVALHTSQEDHEHPVQVFIPYQTIFRVEVHPHGDEKPRRLGFRAMLAAPPSGDQGKPETTPEAKPDPAD